jgi:hypothetical protein
MKEHELRHILEKAIWAPSGDNCQPWTFEWDGETLRIFHDSQRAKHPLNPRGYASFIALGCLLESIEVAASEFGFTPQVHFLELGNEGIAPWVNVRFNPANSEKSPLAEQLLRRCTDRREFQGGGLESDFFDKSEQASARLHVLASPERELIDYIVESEQLLVEHPEILPSTLSWARFSLKHARETMDGLSWRNMGAKFWEVPMMPWIRDHQAVFKIAKLSIGPQHRARVTRQLRTSAGVVCVSAPAADSHPERVAHCGSLMMNAWLSLTAKGYGVQPLTLASTTGMCIRTIAMNVPEKWIRFHKQGADILRRHFSIPAGNEPVWMIRTGRSSPLPEKARTFRKPLQSVLTCK